MTRHDDNDGEREALPGPDYSRAELWRHMPGRYVTAAAVTKDQYDREVPCQNELYRVVELHTGQLAAWIVDHRGVAVYSWPSIIESSPTEVRLMLARTERR